MTRRRNRPLDLQVLLVAKAPTPGLAKTRLASSIGTVAAAEFAAAALLDTLATCAAAVGTDRCHLALAGDLDDAVVGAEIRERLVGWSVRAQRGASFAERLANAHLDLEGDRVQIGMDTPQVTVGQLQRAGRTLADHDAVLGPATDGGWWSLAARCGSVATALRGVAMSRPTTYGDTRAALLAAGWTVGRADMVRDVDVLEDIAPVAAACAPGRFRAAAESRTEPAGHAR